MNQGSRIQNLFLIALSLYAFQSPGALASDLEGKPGGGNGGGHPAPHPAPAPHPIPVPHPVPAPHPAPPSQGGGNHTPPPPNNGGGGFHNPPPSAGGGQHGPGPTPQRPVHDNPPSQETHLPNGGSARHYEDGSHQFVSRNGNVKDTGSNGHVTYSDSNGRVTAEVHGGTRITYNSDHSRIVQTGNHQFVERIDVTNGRMERDYSYRNSVINRPIVITRNYNSYDSQFWRRGALWFYAPGVRLGAWNYSYFGPAWANPYRPIWGWTYWNAYPWNGYGWWGYYSSYYWRPCGYYHREYYRPSYAVVDFVLASSYETAWEIRLEEAREQARQRYEDQILAAENDAEAAALQAQQDAAVEQAATDATNAAQAEAQAAANASSGATSVTEGDQDQLASEIEQGADQRANQTPMNTAFDSALQTDNYLFLVSSAIDETFDNGSGKPCKLNVGDILKKDSEVDGTGLVTMKVKVAQPSSCAAGSLITLTIPQLQEIFNAFQESTDMAAQALADGNQSAQQ